MRLIKTLGRLALCAATALAFAACSSETTVPEPELPEPPGGGDQVDENDHVNGEMKSADLCGFVTDTKGNPLEGVTVKSGTHSTVTNRMGGFTLSEADVNEGRSIVTFSKEGYFTLVRSVAFVQGENWTVALCAKANSGISVERTFESANAVELKVGGLVNKLPANGFKNRKTGEAFTGRVKAEMVYLDPNDAAFSEMMPGGDLAAVNASNERVRLVSYGMTSVNLSDGNGTPLQLADGSEATLQFPIPAGMEAGAPAEMPLWSFNESTGLWEQEGMAVKKGDHYEGTVKHFSWVNLDYPEQEGTVRGHVADSDGNPVGNIIVRVGQVNARTDANGNFVQQVPANVAFNVTVESRYYGGYTPEVSVAVAPISPKGTANVNLVLPAMKHVTGQVVSGKDAVKNAMVWVDYNGTTTSPVRTGADGMFSIDISFTSRGQASVCVIPVTGAEKSFSITLTGDDVDAGVLQVGEYTPVIGAMTPVEAKNYIEETARQAVGLFNPENQRALIELCSYFERTYGEYDMPAAWENAAAGKAPRRFFRDLGRSIASKNLQTLARSGVQSWNAGQFTGEFVPDGASRRWIKVAESKETVFSFPYKGNTAVLRVTPSEGYWTMTYDEMTVQMPDRIDISLSDGMTTRASGSLVSNYDAVRHTLRLNADMTAADITASVSLRGTDDKLDATYASTVGGTAFFNGTAAVTGSNMLNPSYLNQLVVEQNDGYDTWTEINMNLLRQMLHTAQADANVLSRMVFRASTRDVPALMDLEDFYFDSGDYSNKEEARRLCQEACDKVQQLLPNNLYLAGSDVSSANVVLRPKLEEENYGWDDYTYTWWEWSPEPLLFFPADGSSYAFEEYFSGAGFASLETQVQNVIQAYLAIWNQGR